MRNTNTSTHIDPLKPCGILIPPLISTLLNHAWWSPEWMKYQKIIIICTREKKIRRSNKLRNWIVTETQKALLYFQSTLSDFHSPSQLYSRDWRRLSDLLAIDCICPIKVWAFFHFSIFKDITVWIYVCVCDSVFVICLCLWVCIPCPSVCFMDTCVYVWRVRVTWRQVWNWLSVCIYVNTGHELAAPTVGLYFYWDQYF